MPWIEHRKMDLKMQFIEAATKPGARIAELCRRHQISRETGYKWIKRFKSEGYQGLEERSRAPLNSPLASAEEMVLAIVEVRQKHPRWGPRKLHHLLARRFKESTPSQSTIARVLRRFGQVRERRKRQPVSFIDRVPVINAAEPNDVWSVDFKGWWRAGDGQRCEPLTVRDVFSRYILAVQVMDGTKLIPVRAIFERLFRKYGLPKAIQCDNGVPFVQVQSRGGLTALSAWWVSLGIKIIRSRPGCPQDNGGHERMHVDLAGDVQARPSASRLEEQRACDKWRLEFNEVRPHDALRGKVPADLYRPSERRSLQPVAFSYPEHWIVRDVRGKNGLIAVDGEEYRIGVALKGHQVALEPVQGLKHRIWFMELDLGSIELAPPGRMIDQLAEAAMNRWPSKTRSSKSEKDDRPETEEAEGNDAEGDPSPRENGGRPRSLRALRREKKQPQGGKKKHSEEGQSPSSRHKKRPSEINQVVHPT